MQLQPQRSQTPIPIEDDALAVDDDALLALPAKSDLSDLSLSSTRSDSPPISVITNKCKLTSLRMMKCLRGKPFTKLKKLTVLYTPPPSPSSPKTVRGQS